MKKPGKSFLKLRMNSVYFFNINKFFSNLVPDSNDTPAKPVEKMDIDETLEKRY